MIRSVNLVNYSLLSDAIFIKKLSTNILGVPPESVSIFIKGDEYCSENIFDHTNNQLFNQMSASLIKRTEYSENENTKVNVFYYKSSDDFFSQIQKLPLNESTPLILFLDNHGTEWEFGRRNYIRLYHELLRHSVNHVRIVIEASKSGSFIQGIGLYNKWYQKIKKMKELGYNVSLITLKNIANMIEVCPIDKVLHVIDTLERLDADMIQELYNLDIINIVPLESDSAPIDQIKIARILYRNIYECGIRTIGELRLVYNVLHSLDHNGSEFISQRVTKETYEIFTKMCGADSIESAAKELSLLSECKFLGPAPEDLKVLTSAGVISDSFPFMGFRINPFTQVTAGSPVMSAAIHEIFLNFGKDPIDFQKAIDTATGKYDEYRVKDDIIDFAPKKLTHWMQLYPQKFETANTDYDRIVRTDWRSLIFKTVAVRAIVQKVIDMLSDQSDALKLAANSLSSTITEDTINKKFVPEIIKAKVPQDLIEAALLERELKHQNSIGGIASLCYGAGVDVITQIFDQLLVSEYTKWIVVNSSKCAETPSDAAIIAYLSLKRLQEAAHQSSHCACFAEAILEELMEFDVLIVIVESILCSNLSPTIEKLNSNIEKIHLITNEELILKATSNTNGEDLHSIQESLREKFDKLILDRMKIASERVILVRDKHVKRFITESLNTLNYISDPLYEKNGLYAEAHNLIKESTERIVSLIIDHSIEDPIIITEIILEGKSVPPPTIPELSEAVLDIIPEQIYELVFDLIKMMDPSLHDEDEIEKLELNISKNHYNLLMRAAVKLNTVKDARMATKSILVEKLSAQVNSFKYILKSAAISTKRDLKSKNYNSHYISLIYELINQSLLDVNVIDTMIKEIAPNAFEKQRMMVIRRCAILGKKLWQESVKGIVSVHIPREPLTVRSLMAKNEADAMMRSGMILESLKNDITILPLDPFLLHSFDEVGLIQDDDIKAIALQLLTSYQLTNNPSTEAIGNRALLVASKIQTKEKLIDACIKSDIQPNESDAYLLLGEVKFECDWKYSQIVFHRRVSDRRSEESAYDMEGKIIEMADKDEYYEDPDKANGYGYYGSGLFHSLSEDHDLSKKGSECDPFDFDKIITKDVLAEIEEKYHLPLRGWVNDVLAVFTGQFAERVKELGLVFTPYKSNGLLSNSRCFGQAYQWASDILPMHRLKEFQLVKNTYARFFITNPGFGEELKRAFIRSFEEADRAVTPFYSQEKTYYRR